MLITSKSLNNHVYVSVLEQIGLSETPLNRYKIMHALHGNRYIYDIIDQLCPSTYREDSYLCQWNDIREDNPTLDWKYKFVRKLNEIYDLNWDLPKSDDQPNIELLNDQVIALAGPDSNTRCLFHTISRVTFGISLIESKKDEAYVIIVKGGKKQELKNNKLIVKENKDGNLSLYVSRSDPHNKWNLDVTMSHRTPKENPIIKEHWEYIKNWHIPKFRDQIPAEISYEINYDADCRKIIDNKEYWEYSLNLRGFLLYLVGQQTEKKKETEYETKEKKKNNKRKKERKESDDALKEKKVSKYKSKIKKVISNKRVKEVAPFLYYWEHLQGMEFDVVKILEKIGSEFQNQLEIITNTTMIDDDYLLLRVIERYLAEIESFFNPVFESLLFYDSMKKNDQKFLGNMKGLYNCRLHLLGSIRELMNKRLININDAYRVYSEEITKYNKQIV